MKTVFFFYAKWATQAIELEPTIEQQVNAKGYTLVKVDAEEDLKTVREHLVYATFPLLILNDGNEDVKRLEGEFTAEQLADWLA